MESKYKKDDVVNLDCGYNGMIDMKPCKVLRTFKSKQLFGDDEINSLEVEICGTSERFTTIEAMAK